MYYFAFKIPSPGFEKEIDFREVSLPALKQPPIPGEKWILTLGVAFLISLQTCNENQKLKSLTNL